MRRATGERGDLIVTFPWASVSYTLPPVQTAVRSSPAGYRE
jgi:hypothetical protein